MIYGNENHDITLSEAAEMTARFRATISDSEKISGVFGKDIFTKILEQSGCTGIRYYYGLDDNNKKVLILVGVTQNGNDMVDGIIAEASFPCPSICSQPNLLNSSNQ